MGKTLKNLLYVSSAAALLTAGILTQNYHSKQPTLTTQNYQNSPAPLKQEDLLMPPESQMDYPKNFFPAYTEGINAKTIYAVRVDLDMGENEWSKENPPKWDIYLIRNIEKYPIPRDKTKGSPKEQLLYSARTGKGEVEVNLPLETLVRAYRDDKFRERLRGYVNPQSKFNILTEDEEKKIYSEEIRGLQDLKDKKGKN